MHLWFRSADRHPRILGAAAALAILLTSPNVAHAADPAVKAKDAGGGFYVWIDGAYEHVALPAFTLGPGINSSLNSAYAGQLLSLNSDVSGYRVSGGIGYRLRGNWPGTNARIELGGLYVDASGTRNQVTAYNSPDAFTLQLLDGRYTVNFACVGICTAVMSLSTSYRSGQGHLRFATDYALGNVWLTPSLAVFGGESRNNQAYALKNNNGFTPIMNEYYNASTRLEWSDVGVRAGLDARAPLANWLSVGLGGWAGVANRRTSFTGTDSYVDTNSLGVVGATVTSAAAASDSRAAFLANLEGNVSVQPMAGVTLRAFGGLNYDSAVPGIRAPSFIGPFNGFTAPTVAAGISHGSTTSYYAGGGLRVGF